MVLYWSQNMYFNLLYLVNWGTKAEGGWKYWKGFWNNNVWEWTLQACGSVQRPMTDCYKRCNKSKCVYFDNMRNFELVSKDWDTYCLIILNILEVFCVFLRWWVFILWILRVLTAFWDVTPCSLVSRCQLCCVRLESRTFLFLTGFRIRIFT